MAARVHAAGVLGAIVVGRAADIDGGPLAAHVGRAAREELLGTGAPVAAGQVDALCAGPAGSGAGGFAFVNVDALRVGVASVAAQAGALVGAGRVETLAVCAANILPETLVLVCSEGKSPISFCCTS